jgi:hypothetical protein
MIALLLGWVLDHRRLAKALGETADVTGTVTINGKPLASGRVYLVATDGRFVGADHQRGSRKERVCV